MVINTRKIDIDGPVEAVAAAFTLWKQERDLNP
jgi:hypothetical protein